VSSCKWENWGSCEGWKLWLVEVEEGDESGLMLLEAHWMAFTHDCKKSLGTPCFAELNIKLAILITARKTQLN